jgi:hypothetical protein
VTAYPCFTVLRRNMKASPPILAVQENCLAQYSHNFPSITLSDRTSIGLTNRPWNLLTAETSRSRRNNYSRTWISRHWISRHIHKPSLFPVTKRGFPDQMCMDKPYLCKPSRFSVHTDVTAYPCFTVYGKLVKVKKAPASHPARLLAAGISVWRQNRHA